MAVNAQVMVGRYLEAELAVLGARKLAPAGRKRS